MAGDGWLAVSVLALEARGDEIEFPQDIHPILEEYCFGCHADGADEGGLAFDRYGDLPDSAAALVQDRDLWWSVLKNVRAGVMPPDSEAQPTDEQRHVLLDWIKTSAFGINPESVDPGRVTLRRLNRTDYRNTIRDLVGLDFNVELLFPPDETGFGFDTVGDALGTSPMLLEKYLQAAEQIVEDAIPVQCKVMPEERIDGKAFLSDDGEANGVEVKNTQFPLTLRRPVTVPAAGDYDVVLNCEADGSFLFDPARYQVIFRDGDHVLLKDDFAWESDHKLTFEFQRHWPAGKRDLTFQFRELESVAARKDNPQWKKEDPDESFVSFEIKQVQIRGPIQQEHWIHPAGYETIFSRDEPPQGFAARQVYAKEVLTDFALRAFRRPPSDQLIERLAGLAESHYSQPDTSFEKGIAKAITVILASPRFLFRFENADPIDTSEFPLIDEYSLASRLSYFLWSTCPDDQLLDLARKGTLREQLNQQIDRMLADKRSEQMTRNFAGQWLRTREAEHVQIDPLSVMGLREELDELMALRKRRYLDESDPRAITEEEWDKHQGRMRDLFKLSQTLDVSVREAMREETELLFDDVVRHDRSLCDLLDCDYTFMNEPLSRLYGIANVEGDEMRKSRCRRTGIVGAF